MSVSRDGIRLTRDFRLGEFSVSDSHPELVEPVPDELTLHVVRLAVEVLQPIRHYAGAMRILSCYRPEPLNVAVGGSATSQHLRAEAADFTCASPYPVFRRLLEAELNIRRAGQIIYYPDQVFIHAALPSSRYPVMSLHVHAPDRGLRYEPVGTVAELERMLA